MNHDVTLILSSRRWLFGLFAAAALALAAGGYWYHGREVRRVRDDKYNDLKAVAELKTWQIAAWRKDRLADARINSSGVVRADVLRWFGAPGDEALRSGILARLKTVGAAYGYADMVLTAPDGRLLLSLDARHQELDADTQGLIAQVVAAREAAVGELARDPSGGQVHLDVAAPILDDARQPVAALVMRTDPESGLYPLIQAWPTPSPSAETLLVRREGDQVLYLNTLRHSPAPALSLRIPMSSADLPAVQAALGKTGVFEGRDYRGQAVVADLRPVPDSPWFMVAKIDAREILAEVHRRGGTILLLVALTILLAGLLAAWLFNHRQRRLLDQLLRAERKEREVQEEIRATFYGIGDGVIASDAQGRVTRMNPVAEQLTGWREGESLGRPLKEVFRIVNEETRAEVESPADRVLRDGTVVGLANHTVLIARDGAERPIADSGSPIRTGKGGIAGVVLVFRDQTVERATQAVLRDREAFSRAVLDAVGANVAVLDRGGVIRSVNGAWERFACENGDPSGGAATGVGVDYLAVARKAQGPSSEGAAEALAGIQDVLAGRRSEFSIEYPCHSPNQQRWFILRATPLEREGGGAVLAHIDITARKQAEHDLEASETRYRRLFESAKDGILILDADTGRIDDVNPFLVALLGYTHDEFLGKRLWEIGLFKDIVASQEAFIELQAKGYVRYEDLPLETRDGRRIEVEFVSNVYPVNSSRVVQCNIRDITERVRARQQEQASNLAERRMLAEAEQTRRALLSIMEDQQQAEKVRVGLQAQLIQSQKLESIGTLAGGVAHEINNPIMGIMNYAQLITDRLGPDSPVAQYATEISQETERVATIVKNLLAFAREDKQSRSPARLCDIVGATLSLIRAVMRHDQVELKVDVSADLPTIQCRSQQIQQVLMNLITNARDALNQRYPGHHADKLLMITARTIEKAGRPWIRATVEDHGGGVPEELRARIFDPFFTTKPRDKGTGLGLSISHGIVKEHGGELSVESVQGQWTRFHVDLPVEGRATLAA